MNKYFAIAAVIFALMGFCDPWTAKALAQEIGESSVEFSEVRTVLRKRCMTCHNVDESRGDLDLSSIASIQSGSVSGPVVVPGKPNESLLYTVSAHLEEPVMPPNSPKIPGRELDLIKRWIEGMPSESSESTASASVSKMLAASEKLNRPAAEVPATEEGLAAVNPLLQATGVRSLVVHPSKPIFVTSGHGQAVVGNYETGQWVGAIDFPFGEVTALKFSADGKTLLIAGGVAGLSGTVIGVDWESGSRKFQVADEVDSILAMDMSENGRLLAVGGPKKVVRIYAIDSNEVVHTLKKHTDWILSLAFSPDGLLLASGDRFGGVFVWNPDDGEVFHALPGHQGPVSAVAWDNGSENLLTGCEDGKLRVWNMHHGEMTTAWDAQVGPILSIAHATNNATLVGGRGNKAAVWFGPEINKSIAQADDHIVQVALDGNGKIAVLGDAIGNISVVSVESGDRQHLMKLPEETGEVNQLLARLATLEAEFIASSEKVAVAAEVKQQAMLEMVPERAVPGPEKVPADSESLQYLLVAAEKSQLALEMGLQNQKDLVAELSLLRQLAEEALKQVAAAEKAAHKSLNAQTELLENASQLVAELRSKFGAQLDQQTLATRLQAEAELVKETESVLKLLEKQSHLQGSEESQLLEKLRNSLMKRTEATAQAINGSTP